MRELRSETHDDVMALMAPYVEIGYFLVPLPHIVSSLGMLVKVPASNQKIIQETALIQNCRLILRNSLMLNESLITKPSLAKQITTARKEVCTIRTPPGGKKCEETFVSTVIEVRQITMQVCL